MRTIFTLILLFNFLIGFGQAQEEKVTITEEVTSFKKANFIDTYDYIFLTRIPTKSLWKFDLTGVTLEGINVSRRFQYMGIQWSNRIQVEYERKINNSFSVNALLAHHLHFRHSGTFKRSKDNTWLYYMNPLRLEIEPRWYFNMSKQVKKGKRASNFSGTYLGLSFSNSFNRVVPPFSDSVSYKTGSRKVMLNLGLQLRIFKNAYINAMFANGFINEEPKENKNWEWQYHTKLGLGLAFGSGSVDSKQRYCEAFKCHLEEKRMFKIDLLNFFPTIAKNRFRTALGFGYEFKLFNSSFSLNTGSHFRFSRSHFEEVDQERLSWQLVSQFSLEPRFYYNQKKRIAKGKAAANLSGPYIGLLNRFLINWAESISINNNKRKFIGILHSRLTATPVWGLQHRIFKNGYFDYKIGFGVSVLGDLEQKKLFNQYDDFNWKFLTELKVGLAF